MKTSRVDRSVLPARAAGLACLGLFAAGIAIAVPAFAQDQSSTALDKVEQEIAPPPVISDSDKILQSPPSEVRDDFQWNELDTDGDGRISRSEGSVNADVHSNFEMTDTNGDGYITQAEREAHDRSHAVEPEEMDDQD
ncbi:hypothetical protein INQ41_11915 [Lysobacter ciconiae]|uniref:EF-hand domain-containing protein n=1 Tax=Novilysobacter ciconiae TaxID=2781022 RepID=A0A7S6UFL0_9GAMM|nr:hypothetical protein [Lysobacter ciconiae]QOW19314.1 hypothetical protein INQ41_11915 [Lysobacter ciconiae]